MCTFAQVFLGPNGEVEEYSVISIQQNTAISSDLILDQTEEHLFIMTHNMVYAHTETLVASFHVFFSTRPSCVAVIKLKRNNSLPLVSAPILSLPVEQPVVKIILMTIILFCFVLLEKCGPPIHFNQVSGSLVCMVCTTEHDCVVLVTAAEAACG